MPYQPIEVPCDVAGNFDKDSYPARNPGVHCPPAWDITQGIEEVFPETETALDGTTKGVGTPTYVLRRLMQYHEWRMELQQEIIGAPTQMIAPGRPNAPHIETQMLYYCIHCTTTTVPQHQNIVMSIWDQAALARDRQEARATQDAATASAQATTPPEIAPLSLVHE